MQVCSEKWDVTFTSLAFRLVSCKYFAYSDDTPLQSNKFGAHDTAVWIIVAFENYNICELKPFL